MSGDKTGGSAFPQPIGVSPSGDTIFSWEWGFGGMTMRDYFAGQAVLGLIANPKNAGEATEAARIAYGIADAMIAERSKP